MYNDHIFARMQTTFNKIHHCCNRQDYWFDYLVILSMSVIHFRQHNSTHHVCKQPNVRICVFNIFVSILSRILKKTFLKLPFGQHSCIDGTSFLALAQSDKLFLKEKKTKKNMIWCTYCNSWWQLREQFSILHNHQFCFPCYQRSIY